MEVFKSVILTSYRRITPFWYWVGGGVHVTTMLSEVCKSRLRFCGEADGAVERIETTKNRQTNTHTAA